MARFIPARQAMTTREIASFTCELRSGHQPTLADVDRLLATIASLQDCIRMQAGRIADAVEEGVLHARVESRVPDSPESVGRRA